MVEICYLCGKEIKEGDANSGDHVIPKLLITRNQPKAKGFDYGRILPTHEKCNNEFGPEDYCIKALKLIAVLDDTNCVSLFSLGDNPDLMGINSDCLKDFTQKDLEFFKLIDVRQNLITDFSAPAFFFEKHKTNPKRDALFTALAVLTKSTAALLVKRKLSAVPKRWRVLAIPYAGADEATDFDDIFEKTRPFDVGVKVWLHPFNSGDWFALYRAQNMLVFFLFEFSGKATIWNRMIEQFKDAECLSFEDDHLNGLIDYQWKNV